MRLYLAGPMRGIPEFNANAFIEATELLRANDFVVYSPVEHDIQSGFNFNGLTGKEDLESFEGFSLRQSLADDLFWVASTADGLALLPGWHKSRGALAEMFTAAALGLQAGLVTDWLHADAWSNVSTARTMLAVKGYGL